MTHSKAASIIESLVSTFNKSGDPGDVLIKYAQDNQLAPAQLERLCQVFNTAKTVSYMKKSASRGGTFSLIPVDEVIEKYTSYQAPGATVKKASHVSVNHDVYRVPNLKAMFNDEDGSVKSASAFVGDEFTTSLREIAERSARLEAEKNDKLFIQGVEDYMGNVRDEISESMKKLAHEVYLNPSLYSAWERDSLSCENANEQALAHIAWQLGKEYSMVQYDRFPMEKKASVKITRDTTGKLDLITELESKITEYLECESMLKEAADEEEEDDGEPFTDEDIARATLGAESQDFDPKGYVHYGPPKSNPKITKSKEPAKGEPAPEKKDWRSALGATPEPRQGPPIPDEVNPQSGVGPAPSNVRFTDTDAQHERRATPAPKTDFDPALKKLDKGVEWLDSKTTPAYEWLKRRMSTPAGGMDKRRMAIDGTRSDLQKALLLQKAILTDPILSEADPDRVVSIYNSLASANPALMADPNLMSYTLREAIQYDGVAPHTYDQLVDINKKQTQSEVEQQKLDEKKYKIG
jgi:hypothetical protein